MTRLWLICGFLSIAFLSNAQVESFQLPDSLFAAGSYRMASVEYERVWLGSGDNVIRTKALLGKVQALNMLGDLAGSERTLHRIRHEGLTDTLSYHGRFQLALCNYLQGKFPQAQDVLDQMYFAIKDSTLTAPSLMIYALALNEERRWSEAKEKMMRMVSLAKVDAKTSDSLVRTVNDIYARENFPKLKNVKTAKVLSLIIPGSGQMYAGKPGQGIASILLQAAALTFTVYSFNVGTYVTSVGAGASMFGRFYAGGVNNAEKIAMRTNYDRARLYNAELRDEIVRIAGSFGF